VLKHLKYLEKTFKLNKLANYQFNLVRLISIPERDFVLRRSITASSNNNGIGNGNNGQSDIYGAARKPPLPSPSPCRYNQEKNIFKILFNLIKSKFLKHKNKICLKYMKKLTSQSVLSSPGFASDLIFEKLKVRLFF
jgi:hypothetical protein